MHAIGKYSISNLPAVKFDGVYRVLACIPETEESVLGFPRFGTSMAAPLDPSQWREIDLEWYNAPILNQGSTSSCVGHGTCSGIEICYAQSGRQLIPFSPYFPYGLINGGRDAGAMISDGLKALMQYGICRMGDIPAGAMFQNQFPQTAFEIAKRFRLAQAYKCGSFEEICAAISLGFVCPLGIMVGSNFSNLDNEGVSPLPAGGGGGHCILGMGLKKSSKYGWLIKIQNSWGGTFGIKGHCYLQKNHFKVMNPDAFAIQSIIDDPQDNTPVDDVPVVTN
jgi:hypothetical protein